MMESFTGVGGHLLLAEVRKAKRAWESASKAKRTREQ